MEWYLTTQGYLLAFNFTKKERGSKLSQTGSKKARIERFRITSSRSHHFARFLTSQTLVSSEKTHLHLREFHGWKYKMTHLHEMFRKLVVMRERGNVLAVLGIVLQSVSEPVQRDQAEVVHLRVGRLPQGVQDVAQRDAQRHVPDVTKNDRKKKQPLRSTQG